MLHEEVCHHNFVLFRQVLSFGLKLIFPLEVRCESHQLYNLIPAMFYVLPVEGPWEILMCHPETQAPSLYTSPRLRPVGERVSVLMHPCHFLSLPFYLLTACRSWIWGSLSLDSLLFLFHLLEVKQDILAFFLSSLWMLKARNIILIPSVCIFSVISKLSFYSYNQCPRICLP